MIWVPPSGSGPRNEGVQPLFGMQGSIPQCKIGRVTPIARLLHAWEAIDQGVDRARRAGGAMASALFAQALSEDEQGQITISAYDAPPGRSEVFDWERRWFETVPPGRLLVGGAGNGVEVTQLRITHPQVDALEPAPVPAQTLRDLPGSGRVVTADYADLVRAVSVGDGPAAPLLGRSYTAIILGWGSLTHVLSPADRTALLKACHHLCPDGPILASFWLARDQTPRRAARVGARLGRAVGSLRGLPVASPHREHVAGIGFGERLTVGEIEALGCAVGRTTLWVGTYPWAHVTWQSPGLQPG
jgi:hypothetical protein